VYDSDFAKSLVELLVDPCRLWLFAAMQFKLKMRIVEWNDQHKTQRSGRAVPAFAVFGAAKATMMKLLGTLMVILCVSLLSCGRLSAQIWDPIITVGQGYTDHHVRQVVRTAGGVVYVVTNCSPADSAGNGNSFVAIYRGFPAGRPASFTEMDPTHHPANGQRVSVVDARLADDGIVRIVYSDESIPAAKYTTFDTTTDKWSTAAPETIRPLSGFDQNRFQGKIALAIDSNKVPHVITGGQSEGLFYSNRIGGSWSAPIQLSNSSNAYHPSLTFDRSGVLHLAYNDINLQIVFYRQLPSGGTWTAQETVATAIHPNTADQGPSIAVDSSNRPWVAYLIGGTVAFGLKRRDTANSWTSVNPGPDETGHSPAIYFDTSDNGYTFIGHDLNIIQPFVKVHNAATGVWGSYTQLANDAQTRDGSASPRFDAIWPGSITDIDSLASSEGTGFYGTTYYIHGTPPGTSGAPAVSLSPLSVNFGNQVVGVPSALTVITLTNSGTAQLNLTSITVTGTNVGDFVLSATGTSPCLFGASSLAAGSSCTFNTTFTPGAIGARSASITVTSNATGSPQKVALAGTGTDFSVSVSPSSAAVSAGGTASATLSVVPAGGFAQLVSLSCGGAPAASTCTISPASVTPDGSAISTANVSIRTTARAIVPPANWPRALRRFPSGTALLAGVAALLLLAFLRRYGDPRPGRTSFSISMGFALLLALLCYSCAGGSANSGGSMGTPPGTYTITLTGTSGNLTRTAMINFTVN